MRIAQERGRGRLPTCSDASPGSGFGAETSLGTLRDGVGAGSRDSGETEKDLRPGGPGRGARAHWHVVCARLKKKCNTVGWFLVGFPHRSALLAEASSTVDGTTPQVRGTLYPVALKGAPSGLTILVERTQWPGFCSLDLAVVLWMLFPYMLFRGLGVCLTDGRHGYILRLQ